jgi:hypothetical protein
MTDTADSGLCILKKEELGAEVICLLKVYSTYYVRKVTGKEGIVDNLLKTEDLKEAETFFEDYIAQG